ncbi:20298_t:CDS:1 [Cetraspora pellucida]|uniref:20298_t:CDS:1 n=1 Tax=Cetraspora pellucida TaxID=1433469 RepID=A0A9N8W961_9GLOM|nr:20298_t:CDS:1 [Cetraspora pellucida]
MVETKESHETFYIVQLRRWFTAWESIKSSSKMHAVVSIIICLLSLAFGITLLVSHQYGFESKLNDIISTSVFGTGSIMTFFGSLMSLRNLFRMDSLNIMDEIYNKEKGLSIKRSLSYWDPAVSYLSLSLSTEYLIHMVKEVYEKVIGLDLSKHFSKVYDDETILKGSDYYIEQLSVNTEEALLKITEKVLKDQKERDESKSRTEGGKKMDESNKMIDEANKRFLEQYAKTLLKRRADDIYQQLYELLTTNITDINHWKKIEYEAKLYRKPLYFMKNLAENTKYTLIIHTLWTIAFSLIFISLAVIAFFNLTNESNSSIFLVIDVTLISISSFCLLCSVYSFIINTTIVPNLIEDINSHEHDIFEDTIDLNCAIFKERHTIKYGLRLFLFYSSFFFSFFLGMLVNKKGKLMLKRTDISGLENEILMRLLYCSDQSDIELL